MLLQISGTRSSLSLRLPLRSKNSIIVGRANVLPTIYRNIMENTREQIESEVRSDIVRALLSLVLPPNWNSELTLKYIVSYIQKETDKKGS